MRIYIVRHSVPEERMFDDDDEADQARPLLPEGEKIAAAMAQWMSDNDEIPNAIIASPAVRTAQTAEIIADALGLAAPSIDVGIGPWMSIRGLLRKLADDPNQKRVCVVSHHESIENGLKLIDGDQEPNVGVHFDMLAMGELRIIKVDRKSYTWKERGRVHPSDLGLFDHY